MVSSQFGSPNWYIIAYSKRVAGKKPLIYQPDQPCSPQGAGSQELCWHMFEPSYVSLTVSVLGPCVGSRDPNAANARPALHILRRAASVEPILPSSSSGLLFDVVVFLV